MSDIRVIIIGGGVVGALAARELTRFGGVTVTLLEKSSDIAGGGATKANSGIAHAGFDAHTGSLKAKFNVAGSRVMEGLCSELGVAYRRNGSMVVAFGGEQEAELTTLYNRGLKNGVEGLSIIDGKTARALESRLSPAVTGALLAETGAVVCPYTLAVNAAENAANNGAEILRGREVVGVKAHSGGFAVETSAGEFECDYIINAAGVFADNVAAMIGDESFVSKPRRGEYLLYDRSLGGAFTRTVFQTPTKAGKGVLVTPTVDGNLLVGPSADELPLERRTDAATTAAAQAAVLELARKTFPDLPDKGVITSFAGVRAVALRGRDDDFIVERSTVNPRFFNAAGIQSPGLTASPAIAEFLAKTIAAENALPLNAEFTPNLPERRRVLEMTADELQAVIAERPDFADIVCRCETVPEGAIVDAVRGACGAVDVDGVKRRVRAGMGRCQGGFCLPRVLEILARETGRDIQTITKNGMGHYLSFR